MALGSAGALQNNHTHRCLRGIISVALFTMPATSTPLPSGVTAPLIADNDRNHGGLIVVLSSFSLFLVLASLAVRVYAAYMRHVVQMKDYVFGIAVVTACTQISVVLAQVHFGWGKIAESIPPSYLGRMKKTGYAADILYVVVLGLSKASSILFYRNITVRSRLILHAMLAVSASVTIVSVFLLAVRCSSSPWDDINIQCDGLFARWQAITALDVILEVVLLAYPVNIIYKLNMDLVKRMTILSIFSCRALLIPMAAVHLYYIHVQIHYTDPSLTGSNATVAAEIHLSLSVVVLVVSSLKPFIAVYEDEQGRLAYTDYGPTSRSKREKSWRFSKSHSKQSSCGDDPILRPPNPNPRVENRNAIVKSVHIQVDREAIELSNCRPTSPATSAYGF